MSSNSDPVIRRATGLDSASAVGVARAVYDEYDFVWDMDDLHDLDAKHLREGGGFWVAELAGQVVGITGLRRERPEDSNPAGCDCSLHRVYVHPDWRRRGVASALAQAAIEAATRGGCRRMAIWTDKRFEGAHRMYEGLGARRVDERDTDDVNDSSEWGYVLDL